MSLKALSYSMNHNKNVRNLSVGNCYVLDWLDIGIEFVECVLCRSLLSPTSNICWLDMGWYEFFKQLCETSIVNSLIVLGYNVDVTDYFPWRSRKPSYSQVLTHWFKNIFIGSKIYLWVEHISFWLYNSQLSRSEFRQ